VADVRGIQGIEQADKLAKLATTVTSTIHKLKISMSHIIKEMKEKLHKEHINRVSKSKISEKAKLPMIEIFKKYKYKVKIPNRKNLMMLTQILTGTSILNYSRSVRVKTRNPFCMYCTNIRETSEHFLTQCTKLDNARVQCFNKKKITMKEIINNYQLSNIIDYIKDSNRFRRYENEQQCQ